MFECIEGYLVTGTVQATCGEDETFGITTPVCTLGKIVSLYLQDVTYKLLLILIYSKKLYRLK